MRKRFLTFCIDLEAFDLVNECCDGRMPKDEIYRISLQGLDSLCSVLNEFDIKVTFFVTYDIAKAFSEKLEFLAKNGHEIALHSISQDHDKVAENLEKQKITIEEAIKRKIFGHRSHKFSPVSLVELKKAGFIYDNSMHPTYVPGRYFNIFKRRDIHKELDMLKVPVSVTPLFRLPFSWLWFRIFGVNYAKLCSRFTYFTQDYINIYFHSWDFGNITDNSLRWPYRLLTYNIGNKTIFNFKCFVDWIKKENITVITMIEYLQNKYQK